MKVRTIDDFLENHQKTWLNATNKTLQYEEPIKLDGDLLRIGDNFVRADLIPELFKSIDKTISLSTRDMPDDLVEHITEYFLRKSGGQVAILDDEIVSFMKKGLPYTLKELCDKVHIITESSLISMDSYIGDDFIAIYSIDKIRKIEPQKDDVVCGGLAVEATFAGLIKIYPFSFRMWCSNGAVHRINDKQTQWYFQFNGGGDNSETWFDIIKKTYDTEVNSTLMRISSLREKELLISDIGQFLRVIVGRNNLPKSVLESLTKDTELRSPINAYDFWNLTTEAYTHLVQENPRKGLKYFKLGGYIGDFIYDHPPLVECRSCGTPFGEIISIRQ